jgi:DNA end-binding protein Ku
MAEIGRAYWTGFLKLALVMIPVRLYPAVTEHERIQFHQIHKPSGERVHYQPVVPTIGPVEPEAIVKGYEYEKGRYVTIDPDDLQRLRLATTDTIEIVHCADADALDPLFVERPYYLLPDGSLAEERYRLLREALARTHKIAIGQVVIGGHERVVAVGARGAGLVVYALRFADEVRRPDEFFAGIDTAPAEREQLSLMEQLIGRYTRPFEPERFVDRYQAALKELVAAKLRGGVPPRPPERRPPRPIALSDALRQSLAAEPAGPAPPGRARAARAARRSTAGRGQGSLLLPVSGGRDGDGERPAEAAPRPRKA